ncbi:MAG TPA: glycosyltransferase [Bryobacteraceae bacterium]|nr:glycosyltransferase [Bryobacteraceae bacterium]
MPNSTREARVSNVIVVLPAYNERQHIGPLLETIDDTMKRRQMPYQVLVVDDGSIDGTLQILEGYQGLVPVRVHRHEVNRGLGATIRDGLRIASEIASDQDVVITMDADETHMPGLIPRMCEMIGEGRDVVIASRYQPGAAVVGLSFLRRILSYGASFIFRIVFPTRGVRDFTCGFRAYRGSVLRHAVASAGDDFVESDGFACMAEILLTLRAVDAVFGEVPIILRYDFKQGGSKMRIARTIRQTFAMLMRYRFRPARKLQAAVK